MTEKLLYLKQHYVPKWYQRNFSSDSHHGHIWVYDVDSKNLTERTITETAQEENFYVKGGQFEQFLNIIEDRTSKSVNKLIREGSIEKLDKKTYNDILEFILLQLARTKSEKEIVKSYIPANFDNSIKPRLELPDFSYDIDDLDKFYLGHIEYMLFGKILISDLKLYLIKNMTKQLFFTSDNPILTNNLYYLNNNTTLNGLQSPGLQIYCTLNPKLMLLFIHDDAYKIKATQQNIIEIKDENDITNLNKLHFLNRCQQILSQNGNLSYIQSLNVQSHKMKNKRRICTTHFDSSSKSWKDYLEKEKDNYEISFSFIQRNYNYLKNFKEEYLEKARILPNFRPARDQNRIIEFEGKTEHIIDEYSKMISFKFSKFE